MNTLAHSFKTSNQRRSNFGTKARRFKNLLADKKLLTRAHQELCVSTQALFIDAFDNDVLAHEQYTEWQRTVRATVTNKRIAEREERDRIASECLPLAVKAVILIRLADRCS